MSAGLPKRQLSFDVQLGRPYLAPYYRNMALFRSEAIATLGLEVSRSAFKARESPSVMDTAGSS